MSRKCLDIHALRTKIAYSAKSSLFSCSEISLLLFAVRDTWFTHGIFIGLSFCKTSKTSDSLQLKVSELKMWPDSNWKGREVCVGKLVENRLSFFLGPFCHVFSFQTEPCCRSVTLILDKHATSSRTQQTTGTGTKARAPPAGLEFLSTNHRAPALVSWFTHTTPETLNLLYHVAYRAYILKLRSLLLTLATISSVNR